MKKIILLCLFFMVMFSVNMNAEERYRIDKVLKEINHEQVKLYNPLFVTTYTSYAINGELISKRYFVATNSPKHNSTANVIKSKSAEHPWIINIDGKTVYVTFYNCDGLEVGDLGRIQYDRDNLYMIID